MTRSQVRRIAGATLLALVALVVTSALGVWQYSRAHRDDIATQTLAAKAVPVQSLVKGQQYVPERAFGRQVWVARGTLEVQQSLLSCGRVERGLDGCWVIAPLHIGDIANITVYVGFTPNAEADATLAALRAWKGLTEASFSGRLQPGELIDRGHAVLEPSTRVQSVNVNELAMRWNVNLLDGYIVLDSAPQVAGLTPGVTSELILPPSGITWRNLFYAWQWWTFAAFVLFLLWRYIGDVRADGRSIAAPDVEEH